MAVFDLSEEYAELLKLEELSKNELPVLTKEFELLSKLKKLIIEKDSSKIHLIISYINEFTQYEKIISQYHSRILVVIKHVLEIGIPPQDILKIDSQQEEIIHFYQDNMPETKHTLVNMKVFAEEIYHTNDSSYWDALNENIVALEKLIFAWIEREKKNLIIEKEVDSLILKLNRQFLHISRDDKKNNVDLVKVFSENEKIIKWFAEKMGSDPNLKQAMYAAYLNGQIKSKDAK